MEASEVCECGDPDCIAGQGAANMSETTGPKERVYNELISPLMNQIMAICDEHKITVVADIEVENNDTFANVRTWSEETSDEFWRTHNRFLQKMADQSEGEYDGEFSAAD